jgi:hypothetical protein
LEFFNDAKAPDHKFVDFEPTNLGATDRQPTDSHGADRQNSHRGCAQRKRAQCS